MTKTRGSKKNHQELIQFLQHLYQGGSVTDLNIGNIVADGDVGHNNFYKIKEAYPMPNPGAAGCCDLGHLHVHLEDNYEVGNLFGHVVHSIKRMNLKHKNEAKNQALQSVMFKMLQEEDEAHAKKVLVTLCELYRRKVWFDDRTANVICTAFHPASELD